MDGNLQISESLHGTSLNSAINKLGSPISYH